MNHEELKQNLYFYFIDEISDYEKKEVEAHISFCKECNEEFNRIKEFTTAVQSKQKKDWSETDLINLRRNLFDRIKEAEAAPIFIMKKSLLDIISDRFQPIRKIAINSAFSLLIGLVAGYFLFGNDDSNYSTLLTDSKNNIKILDINIMDPFDPESPVEITFSTSQINKTEGNLSDEDVRMLMANSLISSKNAGLKIETLNSFKTYFENTDLSSSTIKSSLISAVKIDENPSVRRESLLLLSKFSFDHEIRDAILFVLSHDDNSGNRIAAINILTSLIESGIIIDDVMKEVLINKAEKDNNDLIRLRAASFIQEVL